MPVPSGVPQGSLLGPLLFNVALDDVFRLHLSPGTRLNSYADDIVLIRHTRRPTDQETLRHALFAD